MRTLFIAAGAACFASAAVAAELRPDQKAAVERILADLDPSMREAARPQVEQSVAMLSREQVAMFVAGLDAGPAPEPASAPRKQASSADLDYNRRQYEPAIRRSWQAQKAFDDFVDAQMAAKCPDRHRYAVVDGPARYELRMLAPTWPRASWNVETDVAVLGPSYAPQDGRYDFDFSGVRTGFDKAAVSAAVGKACADWTKEAAAFQLKARALVDAKNSRAAFEHERAAAAVVAPIEAALNGVLAAEAPSANHALVLALQNPRPARR